MPGRMTILSGKGLQRFSVFWWRHFEHVRVWRFCSDAAANEDRWMKMSRVANVEETRFRKKPRLAERFLTDPARLFDFNAWYKIAVAETLSVCF